MEKNEVQRTLWYNKPEAVSIRMGNWSISSQVCLVCVVLHECSPASAALTFLLLLLLLGRASQRRVLPNQGLSPLVVCVSAGFEIYLPIRICSCFTNVLDEFDSLTEKEKRKKKKLHTCTRTRTQRIASLNIFLKEN